MTEAAAIEALTQRWIDAWPALQPGVPYTFENESYDSVDSFVRVSIVPTVREQSTMGPEGGRQFTMRGQIFVQLFGAIDKGVRPLYLLADDVRKVYEGRRIASEISTHAGSTRISPGDGRWHMLLVVIPYWVEEQR